MSHHQTTPATIPATWIGQMWSKFRRDKCWLCNSLRSMLSSVSHVPSTTWPSEMAKAPPWWRRSAAPPCRPTPSSAQATESSCTSRLTAVLQGLVGASAGLQWHRVSVKIYVYQSKDMLFFCKIVSVPTNKEKKHFVKISSWALPTNKTILALI